MINNSHFMNDSDHWCRSLDDAQQAAQADAVNGAAYLKRYAAHKKIS
ncbi:MAG: hypothetical protein OEM02_07395 [Desulfobulbaceae bacterium]|nr:hypothetical protein [Desulfobulbaceae bacterium]